MIATRASTTTHRAPSFVESPRAGGEGNAAWLTRHLPDLMAPDGEHATDVDDPTFVVLLSRRSPCGFRLRVAQSHLRHDLTPSHWSHVALLQRRVDPAGRSVLVEVSLEPEFGFGLPAAGNGLQTAYLDWYDDPATTPNIAVLRVPVSAALWTAQSTPDDIPLLELFGKQRAGLDVPLLMLRWLGFVWGAGTDGNPLLDGVGVPSAAAVEALLATAGYDLCPGLDSRVTSPEAFWQTARWWHPTTPRRTSYPCAGRGTSQTGSNRATPDTRPSTPDRGPTCAGSAQTGVRTSSRTAARTHGHVMSAHTAATMTISATM